MEETAIIANVHHCKQILKHVFEVVEYCKKLVGVSATYEISYIPVIKCYLENVIKSVLLRRKRFNFDNISEIPDKIISDVCGVIRTLITETIQYITYHFGWRIRTGDHALYDKVLAEFLQKEQRLIVEFMGDGSDDRMSRACLTAMLHRFQEMYEEQSVMPYDYIYINRKIYTGCGTLQRITYWKTDVYDYLCQYIDYHRNDITPEKFYMNLAFYPYTENIDCFSQIPYLFSQKDLRCINPDFIHDVQFKKSLIAIQKKHGEICPTDDECEEDEIPKTKREESNSESDSEDEDVEKIRGRIKIIKLPKNITYSDSSDSDSDNEEDTKKKRRDSTDSEDDESTKKRRDSTDSDSENEEDTKKKRQDSSNSESEDEDEKDSSADSDSESGDEAEVYKGVGRNLKKMLRNMISDTSDDKFIQKIIRTCLQLGSICKRYHSRDCKCCEKMLNAKKD